MLSDLKSKTFISNNNLSMAVVKYNAAGERLDCIHFKSLFNADARHSRLASDVYGCIKSHIVCVITGSKVNWHKLFVTD